MQWFNIRFTLAGGSLKNMLNIKDRPVTRTFRDVHTSVVSLVQSTTTEVHTLFILVGSFGHGLILFLITK